MIQKIAISLIIAGTLFLGCGTDERLDSYGSQPSVLLTKYNISHMRLHLNSKYNAVLTFSNDTFSYTSGKDNFEGTWSIPEEPIFVTKDEEIVKIIQSIDYVSEEGYRLSSNFLSNGFELEVGDTFILTGDHLLSGRVTQIELNNL